MTQLQVKREITSDAPADEIWARARQFTSAWHPDIAWMKAEDDGKTRCFGVTGESGEYVERLTYYSSSERRMGYTHLSGIGGIEGYNAWLTVSPEGDGSRITWQADLSAPSPRAEAIAAGTGVIFERGLAALISQTAPLEIAEPPEPKTATIERRSLGQVPRLSILTAERTVCADTLLLFLHGIGGAASNWQAQLEQFGTDYALAALDMRGYGDSTLGFRPSDIDAYCADIELVMQHFSAKRVVLCGLSMGAWIATSFAMRHSNRLAGLVLAGGCTGMSEADEAERSSFRLSREKPLAEGQTPADFAGSVIDVISGPNAPETARRALLASMTAIPAASYGDALSVFCNPLEQFDFARITCPVLLMTGEHDRLAPPSEIRAVATRMQDAIRGAGQIPDIRFEMLPDTGHVCNLESPDGFNAPLAEFLSHIEGLRPTRRSVAREAVRLEKHERILAAAHEEFCSKGFSGASMDDLAARAAVSKPTLYRYFGDKHALFAAVLERGRAHLVSPLSDAQEPFVDALWRFSWIYAEFVLRPDMLSLARLILGEAARYPEHVAHYHDNGPGRALLDIVAFLRARAAAGEAQINDPTLAAHDLWSLILSGPRDYYMHHVDESPSRTELIRNITHGLSVFLRAYSCHPKADLARLHWFEARENVSI